MKSIRRNIFLKSILRRRLGTALLALLAALATFTVVLRVTESRVVRGQIEHIAEYYRAVGYVAHPDLFGDVQEAAALIEGSEQVAFVDRRRAVQGFLTCRLNANITGMPMEVLFQNDMISYDGQRTEAIIYGRVFSKEVDTWSTTLHILAEEVLFGHREHVREGDLLLVRVIPTGPDVECVTAGMEINERYLLRLAFIRQYMPPPGAPWGGFTPITGPWVPRWGHRNPLNLIPLHGETWFTDDSASYAVYIEAAIEELHRSNSQLYIQTTRDMEIFLALNPVIRLREGRFLTREDELLAHPVAVVDATFALNRGVDVGDVLVLQIPSRQYFAGAAVHPAGAPGLDGVSRHPEFRVPRVLAGEGAEYYTLELTVVGISQFLAFNRDRTQSLFVFIPDSVLPQRLEITHGMYDAGYLPDAWFGFTVADMRYQYRFAQTYAEPVAAMGLQLVVQYEDAGNFWASADPILLTMTFNIILFGLVAVVVLGLAAYLFIRRHVREAAVMRALGRSASAVFACLIASAALLVVPSAALGGGAAWVFGRMQSERTLAQLGEAYDETVPPTDFELQWEAMFDRPVPETWDGRRTIEYDVHPDTRLLWVITGAVGAVWLGMLAFGTIRVLRLPVLVQLQGGTANDKAISQYNPGEKPAAAPLTAFPEITLLPTTSAARRINGLAWVMRHIRRAPAKTALTFCVALFFMLSLGWLMSSIQNTRAEIDRLYRSTYITGYLSGGFNRPSVRAVLDSEYLYDVYIETLQTTANFVTPVGGTLPEGWQPYIDNPLQEFIDETLELLLEENPYLPQGFDLMPTVRLMWQQQQNTIIGINNKETFLQNHGFATDDAVIEYILGFDDTLFDDRGLSTLPEDAPLPVVVNNAFLQARDKTPGDILLVAFNPFGMHGQLSYRPVRIVGTHELGDFILMPFWVMPFFRTTYHYTAVRFTIDPVYNPNLRETVLALRIAANPRHLAQGAVVNVDDDELRTVVLAMSQVLLLMTLFLRVVMLLALGIGGALACLLVMAHAKNAAILRTLGAGRKTAAMLLCTEQLLVCAAGILPGVAVLLIIGSHVPGVLIAALVYLAGAVAGMAAGALLCTRHAPLDLLQVRE